MNLDKIMAKDVVFSLDIGTRAIKGAVGIVKNKKFHVLYEEFLEHEERAMIDGQIHDIETVATSVNQIKYNLESKIGFKLGKVAIAAAGRFLKTVEGEGELSVDSNLEIDKQLIRSLEVTALKDAENKLNINSDGKLYCVGYSVKNYYLNGYIISNLVSHKGENIKVQVIATFLPRSVVDSLYAVMNKVNLKVENLTLEPIAALEAIIPKNLRLLNIALVDIGAGTSDIAICNKETISAYGMVPKAGDEITEIIAQAYLVDFNTAENIKKQCKDEKDIVYTDVLGFENTIKCEEVKKVIEQTVDKISDEVATKIVDLNGGKAPAAVFLVGGGAYTPMLEDKITERLNIPKQRIAIKGREGVTDCICEDKSLGSVGVTVLGIALVAMKSLGKDFVDVNLNGNPISLFNSHKHTVMDVLLQAGINPKILIAKNGKNMRFTINGSKRIAFGGLGTNAKLKINGEKVNLDTEVSEGDNIEIEYAKQGVGAKPKVYEYLSKNADYDEINIYLNGKITSLEPIVFINGQENKLESEIKEEDNIQIIYPKTIKELKELLLKKDVIIYNNEVKLSDNDKVTNLEHYTYNDTDDCPKINNVGDRKNFDVNENKNIEVINKETYDKLSLKNSMNERLDSKDTNINITLDEGKNLNQSHKLNKSNDSDENYITVTINNEKKRLKGKKEYIFVDIFKYIDIDLTLPKGNINLKLNKRKASYIDKLKDGDIIEVYWS